MMKFVGAGIALALLAAVHGGASANEDTDAAYQAAACLTLQAFIEREEAWLAREGRWLRNKTHMIDSNSIVRKRAIGHEAVRLQLKEFKREFGFRCGRNLDYMEKQVRAVCTTDDPELRELTKGASACSDLGIGRR